MKSVLVAVVILALSCFCVATTVTSTTLVDPTTSAMATGVLCWQPHQQGYSPVCRDVLNGVMLNQLDGAAVPALSVLDTTTVGNPSYYDVSLYNSKGTLVSMVTQVKPSGSTFSYDIYLGTIAGLTTIADPDVMPTQPKTIDDEFSGSVVNSKWVWTNQQGTTTALANGRITFTSSTVLGVWSLFLQPLSGVWTVETKIQLLGRYQYDSFGICVIDSSTGHRANFGLFAKENGGGVEVQEYTDISTYSGDVYADHSGQIPGWVYLKVQKDSTNLTYFYSYNGINWTQVYQEAMATFIANPDHVGFGLWSTHDSATAFNGVAEFFRQIQ